MNNLRKYVCKYLFYNINAQSFFYEICNKYDVVLFGGCVRDIIYNKLENWRDIDIVLCNKKGKNLCLKDTMLNFQQKYFDMNIKKNQFGGYKVKFGDLTFDLWMLADTWAFREGILLSERDNLLKSVFLNIDGYAYDWNQNLFLEQCDRKKISMIDIVLEKNPNVLLNLIRAQYLSRKYDIPLSQRLLKKIEYEKSKVNYKKKCIDVQLKHYGKVVINMEE